MNRLLLATAVCALGLSVTGCHRGHEQSHGVVAAPATYVISGTIKGLTATGLTLQDNGGNDLTVLANSNSFEFPSPVAFGSNYDVTVSAQPAGLTCTVNNGTGTSVTATVNNIAVACSVTTYTIGGTVTGLTTSGLTLQDNGADALTVAANATSFQFADPVSAGGGYAVTVATQPTGLTCSVGQGTGSNLQANVGSVQVTCSTSTLTIGGTVSGLTSGGLVLQNNGGDNLSVASGSSSFSFDTPVAYAGAYDVTVLTQPAGQTCTVNDGSGNATQTVSDVSVSCVADPIYTIVPSAGPNGTILPSTPQAVNAGSNITFTAVPASGFVVDQWLVDGSAAQSGGSVYTLTSVSANHTVQATFAQTTLSLSSSSLALSASGAARQIIVTNTGSIAATNVTVNSGAGLPVGTFMTTTCATLAPSSSCSITVSPGAEPTSGCGSGIAPTPSVISVSADDATTTQATVSILSVGCIYQDGYVYSIDDTTPATSSIGGAVAAASDASAGIAWDNGSYVVTGASSLTDGASNTASIVAAQGAGSYAAILCTEYAGGGYNDWYLPAQNELSLVYTNLAANGIGGFSSSYYWTSSEFTASPTSDAWAELITSGTQIVVIKGDAFGVRCVRRLN